MIAVSNPEEASLVGRTLKTRWVSETLALTDTQAYSVSAFEPTPLYGNKHTYIYGAAIARPGSSDEIVGGIGIVSDSEPQFNALLQDSLPRNDQGKIREACSLFFVPAKKRWSPLRPRRLWVTPLISTRVFSSRKTVPVIRKSSNSMGSSTLSLIVHPADTASTR